MFAKNISEMDLDQFETLNEANRKTFKIAELTTEGLLDPKIVV